MCSTLVIIKCKITQGSTLSKMLPMCQKSWGLQQNMDGDMLKLKAIAEHFQEGLKNTEPLVLFPDRHGSPVTLNSQLPVTPQHLGSLFVLLLQRLQDSHHS